MSSIMPNDNDHLWAVDVDGSALIHVPHPADALDLEMSGHTIGGIYRTACGMHGEAAIYVADEYDVEADDFCAECAEQVAEDRAFLDELKRPGVVAEALAGIGVNVPTTIIESNRPRSASRDRLFDPRPTLLPIDVLLGRDPVTGWYPGQWEGVDDPEADAACGGA
jgi:hypothetical protein